MTTPTLDEVSKDIFVSNIKMAVFEITGLSFEEFTSKSRQRDAFYARMLFAKHCIKVMLPVTIAKLLNRDRSTIWRLLNIYMDETKYNPVFRDLAQQVNDRINEHMGKQGL